MMSNATAYPLHNERRAQLSSRLPDGSRDLIIPLYGSDDLTNSDAQELAQELSRLGASFRNVHLATILRGVNDALRLEEDPEHSSLTEAETAALRAAGSLVESRGILPIKDRPSVRTAIRQQQILADALTTDAVAHLLGVSTGRVRQRNGEGSLFAVAGPGHSWRFPRFQFTERGELPGWGTVCKVFTRETNPVAVEYFLTHAHPDLDGGQLTPAQWLAAGKPAEPVAALAEQAFTIR